MSSFDNLLAVAPWLQGVWDYAVDYGDGVADQYRQRSNEPFAERVGGDLEALLAIASQIGNMADAGITSGMEGVGRALAGQPWEENAREMNGSIQDRLAPENSPLTYTNVSPSGENSLRLFAEAMSPSDDAGRVLGDAGFEAYGPWGGVAGEMAPDLAEMLFGLRAARPVAKADVQLDGLFRPPAGSPSAQRGALLR